MRLSEIIKQNTDFHRLFLPTIDTYIEMRPLKTKEVKYIAQMDIKRILTDDNIKEFKNYDEYKKEFDDKMSVYKNVLSDTLKSDIDIENISFLDFTILLFFQKQLSNAMSMDNMKIKCNHCGKDFVTSINLDSDDIQYTNKEKIKGFSIDTSEIVKGLSYNIKFNFDYFKGSLYSMVLYIKTNSENKEKYSDIEHLNDYIIYSHLKSIEILVKDERVIKDIKEISIDEFKEFLNELPKVLREVISKEFMEAIPLVSYKTTNICVNCGKEVEVNLNEKSF